MTPPPSIEHLQAGEIARLAHDPGLVLIPVSPAFEWHSYHLPAGTDAILVEEIANRLAARLGATYFRTLALGLDAWRDAAFKQAQGIDPATEVFGMNFPSAPMESEYTTPPVMRALVESRLRACRGTGFRLAALVNHHGGCGQVPLLDEIARAWSSPGFQTVLLHTSNFSTFQPPPEANGFFSTGGHAGLAETLQLMAFRPDLVDCDLLDRGDLKAARCGILHTSPTIPAACHPSRATLELARLWGDNILENMSARLSHLLQRTGPS